MSEKNWSADEFLNHLYTRLEDHIVAAIQRANVASLHNSHPIRAGEGSEKQLLTVREVAALLSISIAGVYHWAAIKRIPHIRMGRYLRFNRSEIIEWVNTNKNMGTR